MTPLAACRTPRWAALMLLPGVLLLAEPASAEDAGSAESPGVTLAEQRAAEAFQAYNRKEYAVAVALYLQAYDAAPNGSILYNIARIYDTKLADRPLAITYYRRYIADPGAYTERIEFANQRLRQLREAETLSTKLAESEQRPDGPRAAEAQASDPSSKQRGDSPTHADEPGWSALRWSGVAVGSVGLAALATGAGFGLYAMSKKSSADESCDGNACTSQRGVDAAKSAKSAASVANIGLIGGGALLATGAVLFVLGSDEPSSERPRTAVALGPTESLSGLSLRVDGRW